MKPEELLRRQEQMANRRKTWEGHWDDIADLTDPTRSSIMRRDTPGAKRRGRIFDGTATHASGLLAASLLGAMTSPGGRWMGYAVENPAVMDDREAVLWLANAEAVTYKELHRSNFYLQVHEVYIDLVTFGTAALYAEWSENGGYLNFDTIPLGEYYIAENSRGIVDTLFRAFCLTVRQAAQEYGEDKLSERVKRKFQSGKLDEEVHILHAVHPNSDRVGERDDYKGKRVYSCYIERDTKTVLREAGFDEMPYMVPRWTVSPGEMYGRSPAMTALPDMKVLNKAVELELRAWGKAIDPPLLVANDGIIGKIRTTPAAIMSVRTDLMVKGIDPIRALPSAARFDVTQVKVQELRDAVRRAFYVDQLQLQEGPQMTATEVNQRTDEKLRLLAPILGRLQSELLRPLVERVFGILLREGKFGTPPASLQGHELKIEFLGPMARMQNAQEVQAIQQVMTEIGGTLGTVKPEIFDNIDADAIMRLAASARGVPPKVMLAEGKVKQIRDARNKAALEAQQKADMERAGNVAAKFQGSGAMQ